MITIVQENRQDQTFLLKITDMTPEQIDAIYGAICAEGDSDVDTCGEYWMVVVNTDYTTFTAMSDVIRGLMDKYNPKDLKAPKELKSEMAYFMMLQEGESARVYLKEDVDNLLAYLKNNPSSLF